MQEFYGTERVEKKGIEVGKVNCREKAGLKANFKREHGRCFVGRVLTRRYEHDKSP